jgi:hypothetical protein
MKEKEIASLYAMEYLNSVPAAGEMFEIKAIETRDEPLLSVYVLNNVYLFPDGLVISKRGIAIKDCMIRDTHIKKCLEHVNRDNLIDKLSLISNNKKKEMRSGNGYVSLLGPWCTSFWHWMMEFTPKVIMAEALGFAGKYIVSPSGPDFIAESLSLLNISRERVVAYNVKEHFLLEKLVLPQRVEVNHGLRFLYLLNLLRKILLKGIVASDSSPKRIYISRKCANNGRHVVNESSLLKLLYEFGFQDFSMEGKPLKEQIQLMANANWLVSGSGAGLFHCLVMPESSFIIELFSPSYIHPCMLSAIELLKHNYFMITSYNDYDYEFGDDIHAYTDLIRVTIQNQLHNNGLRT